MKKFISLSFATLITVLCFGQKNKTSINSQIDTYVQKEMKEVGIPGMAVAVIKDGKVIHSKTYGTANTEWDLPVTPRTSFQIASVTKLFTSTLVMKWMQEGRISLDDYISKYIPSSPDKWKTIQIKHLLPHESGIRWPKTLGGYIGTGSANNFKVETMDDLIAGLKDTTLTFEPGTKQFYPNGDYFILQYIIEKLAGKPFHQVIAEEVLQPLDMNDSGFDVETRGFPFQTMNPVPFKSQNFTKGKTTPLIFKGYYSPTSYSAGGMFLSLSDATKWAIALDKGTFITKAMQEKISVKTPANEGFTQLGWTIQDNNGHVVVGHSGGPGLGDIVRLEKEKLTVIVLSNYADMMPYLALPIAKFFTQDLKLPENEPKSFERNLAK